MPRKEIDGFLEIYNEPLPLQYRAANVIRTSLKPNAIVGTKTLVAQGKLPPVQLSDVITLGVTKDIVRSIISNYYM